MIVVDTNVISALTKHDSAVRQWLLTPSNDSLTLSVISLMEITYGIARLPDGRRRSELDAWWRSFQDEWSSHLLEVSPSIANMAAIVKAAREGRGRPISTPDALIAATCLVHDAPLATRNTKDFKGLGIEILNPWDL